MLKLNCVGIKYLFFSLSLLISNIALGDERDWSLGGYGGKYYDSEPAGLTQGNANFFDQYMLAITASRTVWRLKSLPLALEIDGMVGHQFGLVSLNEFAIAPAIRWSGFPWNEILQTGFRVAPLGISYTSSISSLERGPTGNGSHLLNFLFLELAFSPPQQKSHEVFVRLHHRCAIYDQLNNYGANGEDFLVTGYRRYF